MIFNITFNVLNIANKLQISISHNTKVGELCRRESVNEYTKDGSGNYLITPHTDHDFLIKNNNNYFVLSGKVKIRYEWADGDKFKNEHKDTFKSFLEAGYSEQHQDMKTNYKHGDGYMENTVDQAYRSPNWSKNHLPYEPYCSVSEVTIMEDDTVLLCPMQHTTGWTFETIDIMPFEKIISSKVGTEMYVIFGRECHTWSKDGKYTRQVIEKHSVKKQTSSELEINNSSGDICTLVRVYK